MGKPQTLTKSTKTTRIPLRKAHKMTLENQLRGQQSNR
jgi:hypothetical protein